MKCYYDLHMHTCLSPCGDDDMTPNNIVGMAMLKGLDIIAITDHNTIGNCAAVMEAARNQGDLVVVPAMELCTTEEIHLLCYFPDLFKATYFQKELKRFLPAIKNREYIFGRQIYMDSEDRETGLEEGFLAGATTLDAEAAIKLVRTLGGAAVPAHVDRESFSMLYTLGTIPKEYGLHYLECSRRCEPATFIYGHQTLADHGWLRSSDAHILGDINERHHFMELQNRSAHALIERLNAQSDGGN